MRKAFQCLEIMLDTIGDGKAADVLAEFLATSHHQDMKKRVADADQHTESIIDKIKVMLSDLHDAGSKTKVNPALNSVRINLLKLLLDIPGMGRDKLLASGFQFGTWSLAERQLLVAYVTIFAHIAWMINIRRWCPKVGAVQMLGRSQSPSRPCGTNFTAKMRLRYPSSDCW